MSSSRRSPASWSIRPRMSSTGTTGRRGAHDGFREVGQQRRLMMARFRIQKHGRLQELIAHENGYFGDEGLDYEFGDFVSREVMGPIVEQLKPVNADGTPAAPGTVDVTTGMFETYAAGRACDV